MRRVLKFVIVVVTAAIVYAPAKAHADGYVSPFVGVNFAKEPISSRVGFCLLSHNSLERSVASNARKMPATVVGWASPL